MSLKLFTAQFLSLERDSVIEWHICMQNVKASMGTWKLGLKKMVFIKCDLLD
jgi:hypothetical protein